jgi:ABC-2 type transport system permease protein
MGVGTMPAWTERIASVLPLKPFNDAMKNQFDPYGTGAGWDPRALAVMVAWGLAGAIVAVRAFRWDPGTRAAPRTVAATPGAASENGTTQPPRRIAVAVPAPRTSREALPAYPGRPSLWRLVRDQVRWAGRAALRDPGWMFFAVAMPIALYAFIMTIDYPALVGPDRVPVALYSAAGMVAWGAAVTAFVDLPQAVATARDRGVLKRLRGTPLTPVVYLVGRTVSALSIAVLTAALVVGMGLVFFDLRIAWAGIAAAVGVLILGTLAMAACGFALAAVVPSAKAMGAVGLGILLPLSFFSDVFVSEGAPAWMSTVGSIGPMKHLTNSLTAALAPAGPTVRWTSIGVLVAWIVVAGALAAKGFRWEARATSRRRR